MYAIYGDMDPINKNPSHVSIFLPAPAGSVMDDFLELLWGTIFPLVDENLAEKVEGLEETPRENLKRSMMIDIYYRSILHGYKLILTSLLVLMRISTFTSKDFFFGRVSKIGNV